MVSLVGCVLPRALEHAQALRAAPVAVPRNLARLPHHAVATLDVARRRGRPPPSAPGCKGWRVAVDDEPDADLRPRRATCARPATSCSTSRCSGCWSGFAGGKLFGYEGQVIVQADGGQFCNTGILGYDSFRAGLRVDGTELDPFCVQVDDFTATYLPNGQAVGLRGDDRLPDRRGPRGGHGRPGGRSRSRSTTRCGSTASASTCWATATRRASP